MASGLADDLFDSQVLHADDRSSARRPNTTQLSASSHARPDIDGNEEKKFKPESIQKSMFDTMQESMLNMQREMMKMQNEMMAQQMQNFAQCMATSMAGIHASTAAAAVVAPIPMAGSRVATTTTCQKVPDELAKSLEAAGKKIERKIWAHIKVQDVLEREIKHRDEMKADSLYIRFPPGVKPFCSPTSGPQLNEEWGPSRDEDRTIGLVIPKGTTRAMVLQILYHQSIYWQKEVWVEYLQERAKSCKAAAQKGAFMGTADVLLQEHNEKSVAGMNELTDEPIKVPEDLVKALAAQIYDKTWEQVKKSKASTDAKTARDLETELKKKERIEHARPEVLLATVIDERIKARDDSWMIDEDVNPNVAMERCQELVNAIRAPKNGVSPSGGSGGQSRTAAAWPKNGKGKGDKGKGKGKSKNKGKSKGKGSKDAPNPPPWTDRKPSKGRKGNGKGGKGKGSGA
jgi:hypothetical protein